jgi:hypothetical protein
MSPIESALVKAAVSGAAIALVLFKTKHLSREDMGLVRPTRLPLTLGIMLLYFGWMLGTNALLGWRGPWDWTPWLAAPLLASILRVLAVGLLGPIASALLLFFGGLMTFPDVWAALLPPAIFVGLHLVEANFVTPLIVGKRLTIVRFRMVVHPARKKKMTSSAKNS